MFLADSKNSKITGREKVFKKDEFASAGSVFIRKTLYIHMKNNYKECYTVDLSYPIFHLTIRVTIIENIEVLKLIRQFHNISAP